EGPAWGAPRRARDEAPRAAPPLRLHGRGPPRPPRDPRARLPVEAAARARARAGPAAADGAHVHAAELPPDRPDRAARAPPVHLLPLLARRVREDGALLRGARPRLHGGAPAARGPLGGAPARLRARRRPGRGEAR